MITIQEAHRYLNLVSDGFAPAIKCRNDSSHPNLVSWFRNNCRCPVCRYDIREYVTDISNSQRNVDLSSNFLHSSGNNEESPTNFFRRVFFDLINAMNTSDLSGNNLSTVPNLVSDYSENNFIIPDNRDHK